MSLITRFCATLFLISVALPFALASPNYHNPSDCKSNEFWQVFSSLATTFRLSGFFYRYQEKSCCLPYGGPHHPPQPPPEKSCPPSGWSWHVEKASCVPHHPLPPSHPPPQCSSEWEWEPATWSCTKPPSHHKSPHHPKPSGYYGDGGYGGWKRELHQSRATKLCPTGLSACPIPGASGLTGDFECLDTTNELESCGGCASLGQGQDCTAIKGSWNVGCEQGTCAGKSYSSHLIPDDTYSSSSIYLRWWFQTFIGRQILRPVGSLNMTSPY